MNKSILISIQPKYVEKILNGEKTIEIRKTMPKCELPIDVYIYCTKARKPQQDKDCVREDYLTVPHPWFKQHSHIKQQYVLGANYGECLNGKVVTKFTLKNVEQFYIFTEGLIQYWNACNLGKSCIPYDGLVNYIGKGKNGYAWNIDNLEIFDIPKDLNEFLVKAPESWCYVRKEK